MNSVLRWDVFDLTQKELLEKAFLEYLLLRKIPGKGKESREG